jgi:spore coat polysaccharide biosynthesis predicted glycosyltransferase SpsG
MSEADLALGAGGTSSWERCCLGLPTVMIATADNQRLIAKHLSEAGAVRFLGEWSAVDAASARAAIDGFASQPEELRQMAENAATLCDGLGARRLADILAKAQPPQQ